jgi:hypothetical protein
VNQPLRVSLLLLAAILLGFGCNKDETAIRTYSAPKDTPVQEASSNLINWKVPAGWKSISDPKPMRYATFEVSADDPKAQLTVLRLSIGASAVLPNLSRWAGQLKLPAPSESDIPKYVQQTQVSGEQAALIDMTGAPETGNPPTRLLAAIIPHEGQTWVLTLKAAAPLIEAQKDNFEQFVHSIEFPATATADTQSNADAAPPPGPKPPMAQADPSDRSAAPTLKLVKWKAPQGWQEEAGTNAMRVTAFRINSDNQQGEVIVSRIPQGSFGSIPDNINRWRGQVGLEPVDRPEPDEHEQVQVAGHKALLVTFNGPADGPTPARQSLIVIDQEGADFWFIKVLGPKTLVAKQHNALKQFLDSLQFEPESR